MPGASGYIRRTKFDFKVPIHLISSKYNEKFQGYNRFLKKYSKELDLYVKVYTHQNYDSESKKHSSEKSRNSIQSYWITWKNKAEIIKSLTKLSGSYKRN